MRLTIILTIFIAASVVMNAQTPQFKAPEGYTTSVQSVTKDYNFYPLTRTVPLPWNRLPLPISQLATGNSTITALRCPSKTAERFYDNPKKVISSFGTPKRKAYQSFRGKDGDGAILFLEYSKILPMDAREQLSKLFFNTPNPPKPAEHKNIEQFLVNDNTIIIWVFSHPKSQVRQDHQEQIFNLVSEMATKMESAKKK